MAGFFHQLAEQALFPAPRLHPVAGASHAQAGRPEEVTEQVAQPNGVSVSINTSLRVPESPQKAPISSFRSAIAGQTAADAEPPDTGPETHRRRAITAQLPRQDEALRPLDPVNLTALPTNQRVLRASASTHLRKQGDKTTPSPPPPYPSATQPAASPLRPIPVAAIRPPPAQTRQDLRASHTDNSAAPEVHIHIGRIELTAMTAPTVRKRESAGGKKPMSLDEYLQQRGRKMP